MLQGLRIRPTGEAEREEASPTGSVGWCHIELVDGRPDGRSYWGRRARRPVAQRAKAAGRRSEMVSLKSSIKLQLSAAQSTHYYHIGAAVGEIQSAVAPEEENVEL